MELGEVFLCQSRPDARKVLSCSLGLAWRDGEHPVVCLVLIAKKLYHLFMEKPYYPTWILKRPSV